MRSESKLLCNKKGFTLIELIIVMALISLILVGAFSIFSFGNRTFYGGTDQRNLQSDIRFSMETLTHDVRYATKLEVLTSGSISIGTLLTVNGSGLYDGVNPYETYIFYDENTSSVVRLQRESMEQIHFPTDSPIPLTFNLKGTPETQLSYKIDGINETNSKSFDIKADVLMLNILQTDGTSKASGANDGVAIRYRTPESLVAEMQFPETQLISTNNNETVVVTFNKPVKYSSHDVTAGSKSSPITPANVGISPKTYSTTTMTAVFIEDGKPKEFVNGDTIVLTLTYGSDNEYNAVYSLVYSGSKKKWDIE